MPGGMFRGPEMEPGRISGWGCSCLAQKRRRRGQWAVSALGLVELSPLKECDACDEHSRGIMRLGPVLENLTV